MRERTYEIIIEDVAFGFEEFMEELGFTVVQATSKTIEDNYFLFQKEPFIKYAYLVRLGVESIDRGEIADYLYEKLTTIGPVIAQTEHKEIELLKRDFELYQKKQKTATYDVIETPFPTKASADYHLGDGLYKESDCHFKEEDRWMSLSKSIKDYWKKISNYLGIMR